MKNKILTFLLMGLFAVSLTNCSEEDEEVCEQDEICASESVTTCCDNDVCTWQYDGRTYSEDELAQLASDLGCTSAVADLIPSLQALAAKAQAQL